MPKPGHNKRHVIEQHIVVEGAGEFPFDMLRYDCCYPATETDSRLMRGGSQEATRTLRLIMRSGNGHPTPARWLSYGWTVLGVIAE